MLLVTDLDGTLCSWADFIVPALDAMIASLVSTTGETELRVVQALKQVYERHGSNEYPWAVQESALFSPYSADFGSFDRLVIDPAREAFARARRRYLRPFPTVLETLDELRADGVRVVVLTDAPRNAAEQRISQLGLASRLEALFCLPGFPYPATGVAEPIRRRGAEGRHRLDLPVHELPREHEKPDPRGYLSLCAALKVRPEETLFVGDNRKKDVAVAREVGAVDVWAAYGTYVAPAYRERLEVLSAHSVTRRHVADASESAKLPIPSHVIGEFAGVLPLVRAKRKQRSRRR